MIKLSFNFKQFDWRHYDTWLEGQKNTLILGCGLIAFLVLFLFFNTSQYSALSEAKAQETTLKITLQTAIPQVVLFNAQKAQVIQLKALIKQYTPYLSNPEQLGTVLDNITFAAANNQLDLQLLKPQAMVSSDFYDKVPIEVALNGDYQQLGLFLNQLANLPYFIYPRELKLQLPIISADATTAPAAPGALNLHMTIDMYSPTTQKPPGNKP